MHQSFVIESFCVQKCYVKANYEYVKYRNNNIFHTHVCNLFHDKLYAPRCTTIFLQNSFASTGRVIDKTWDASLFICKYAKLQV